MKLSLANTPKLRAALDQAQQGARTRLLNSDQVVAAAAAAEHRLDEAGLSLLSRRGVRVTLDPYRVANCYDYSASTSYAVLERGNKFWSLVEAGRKRCEGAPFGRSRELHISIPWSDSLLSSLLRKAGLALQSPPLQSATSEELQAELHRRCPPTLS